MKRTATALAATAAALLHASGALAATSYPNDYFFAKGYQWALSGAPASIQAPAAWCAGTGAGKVVAMIDTGADFSHPDLSGKLIAGAAFTGATSSSENSPTGTGVAAVTDHEGHGTATTGVVVAVTGNGQGIAAVAPDARALVMEVAGSDGKIYQSDVSLAMRWAADHGADVINVSLGPSQVSAQGQNLPNLTIPSAAAYAASKGVAVVLSAGNDNSSQAVYPNMSSFALVVGALTPQATMAPYSNHGSDVSIYAPGGSTEDTSQMTVQNSVLSTYINSEYAIGGGTSFSAPMVSATVAMLMAQGKTASQAMSAITATAVQRNNLPDLDAAAALGVADSARCGTPSTPPPGSPPPVVSGGGTTIHTSSTTTVVRHSSSTTTTVHTSTSTQQIVSTSTATVATSSAQVVQTPAVPDDRRMRQSLPPATGPSPGGGVPAPVVIGGLGALVLGGAPLARTMAARRRNRMP